MGGVDEHQAGHLVWIGVGVETHVEPTEGMPDQHVGAWDARFEEERVQFADDAPARARSRARVAPAITCPVVGAHPREGRDSRLHCAPIQ